MECLEETVYETENPDNGAGPLWCYGAPLLVRRGDTVYAAGLETDPGRQPLCNTRWTLWRRAGEWQRLTAGDRADEREPCPLVQTAGGLLLSVNPLEDFTAAKGACRPHLLHFEGAAGPRPFEPSWQGDHRFTEHSYRGIASDGDSAVLQLNIDAASGDQLWCLWDGEVVVSGGRLVFGQRACYPQVAVHKRRGHVLAVGDIVEPVEAWRAYKKQQTGRDWDYVFRQLYYAEGTDLSRGGFGQPLLIENVDATAGHILNLDLWLGPDGTVHLLYLRRNVASALMRDRFFPGLALETALVEVELRDGAVRRRRVLLQAGEGGDELVPGYGRYHTAADGRRLVVLYATRQGEGGNYLLEASGPPVWIPLEQPLTLFFTATQRGGSPPSDVLDLFGVGGPSPALRYAQVHLEPRGGKI